MANVLPTKVLSLSLVLLISLAILGADGNNRSAAVLHATGKVQVNHTGSPAVTTLFPGDSVQTDGNSVANIIAGGSSVLVPPSASVIFMGNAVDLVEGGMTIATSAGMSATADGLTITPATQRQSKFDVSENKGTVVIAARLGNVTVSDGQQTTTVPEGQETTRDKKGRQEVPPAAKGGIRISKKTKETLAIIGAGGGVVGLTALSLEMSEPGKRCISSSGDKRCRCKTESKGISVCRQDY